MDGLFLTSSFTRMCAPLLIVYLYTIDAPFSDVKLFSTAATFFALVAVIVGFLKDYLQPRIEEEDYEVAEAVPLLERTPESFLYDQEITLKNENRQHYESMAIEEGGFYPTTSI